MPDRITFEDIDATTPEGRLLLAAIGNLMDYYTDKTPEEIVDILYDKTRKFKD